jgi:hypothetical protein
LATKYPTNSVLCFFDNFQEENCRNANFSLPQPVYDLESESLNHRENDANAKEFFQENNGLLYKDQRHIFDHLICLIHHNQGGLFMVDAPGARGKHSYATSS